MRLSMVFAVLALALAGCASPNPRLYTVAPVPGVAQPGGPRVVRVREVGLARYLQRQEIVRSSENYRLDVLSNDWWGESPAPMLTRVLVESLGQRLPGSAVYGEGGAVSSAADATVEIDIQRMDLDAAGNLVMLGQGAVVFEASRNAPLTQSFRLSVPPPEAGTQGEVAAISAAMGQVADRVAAALRRAPGT